MAKSSSPAPLSASYGIAALESGLKVLYLIGEQPDQTVPQLASTMQMTKSKVFRILRTLESLGYVVIAQNHTVRLGSTALILGHYAEKQFTLTQAAQPVLDELAAATHENVYLLIREEQHALVIDVRMSPHPVRTFAQVGRIGALHAGGAPKVLLAYAPQSVLDAVLSQPLEQFASGTLHDPAELRQTLDDIRRTGVHLSFSDLEEQVWALAVPVFDHQQQVIAALSVAGPMMRLSDQQTAHFTALLLQASRTITAQLGGHSTG